MKINLVLPDARTLVGVQMSRVPCVGEHVLYSDPVSFQMTVGRVSYVLLTTRGGDSRPAPAFDAEVRLVAAT